MTWGFLMLHSLGLLLEHRFQLMQYNAQLYEINTQTCLNENKLEQRLSRKTNVWPSIGFCYSNTNVCVCVCTGTSDSRWDTHVHIRFTGSPRRK